MRSVIAGLCTGEYLIKSNEEVVNVTCFEALTIEVAEMHLDDAVNGIIFCRVGYFLLIGDGS